MCFYRLNDIKLENKIYMSLFWEGKKKDFVGPHIKKIRRKIFSGKKGSVRVPN